jgi:accessory gene regulator B
MAALVGRAAVAAVPFLELSGVRAVLVAGLVPAAVAVWRLAPVDCPAKPITSLARREKLRRLSLVVLALLAGTALVLAPRWPSLALAAGGGLGWQALSLTRTGHRLAAAVDKLYPGRG